MVASNLHNSMLNIQIYGGMHSVVAFNLHFSLLNIQIYGRMHSVVASNLHYSFLPSSVVYKLLVSKLCVYI